MTTSNYRIVKDKWGRPQHQSVREEPTFHRAALKPNGLEWALPGNRGADLPSKDYRGSNLIGDPEPAGTLDRPLVATDAQGTSADRAAALAFSNEPISGMDLIAVIADPDLGHVVADRMQIDLANREVAARDGIESILDKWGRENPTAIGTVDLSGQIDLPPMSSEEAAAMAILLSDDTSEPDWQSLFDAPTVSLVGRDGDLLAAGDL